MKANLTRDKKIEYLKLLEERTYRRKINPIKYIKLFPYQQKFYDDSAHTKFLCGGNRAGKTETIAKYIIDKCLANPKQRWWAVSETYQDSVNILQRKIWQLMPKYSMRYCKWNEVLGFTNKKIIFSNLSQVQFKSYEQGREAFQGDDIDGVANDEEPPYDIYREERMRLLDRGGEMLFAMTSLKGMTDLLMDLYEGATYLESMPAPLLENEVVPRIAEKNGVKFYFLWTPENHHLDADRIVEEAALMDLNEIKSRIYGLPTGVALRIYPMYSDKIHMIKWEDVPDDKVTLYHVLDPHDRKPWAMQWWAAHKTGKKYCVWEYPYNKNFNEMEYDDKTFEDYAKVIDDIEYGLEEIFNKRIERRIIDPNFGNSTVRQIARTAAGDADTTVKKSMESIKTKRNPRGFKFYDGYDKSLAERHIAVKKALHWAEKDGQLVVAPEVYIAEHCQNTRRHLARYSFNDIETQSGDVRDRPKPKEKHKDYSDCTGMYIQSGYEYLPPVVHRHEEQKSLY